MHGLKKYIQCLEQYMGYYKSGTSTSKHSYMHLTVIPTVVSEIFAERKFREEGRIRENYRGYV